MGNSQSRTINASRNAITAIVNKTCVLLLVFISRKLFISYIGIEYLGINSLFTNMLTLLSMADLGMATVMNVSLYKPIAENDEKRLSALINYFKNVYRVIAIVVTVIGLGLIPFLPYIVNLDSQVSGLYIFYIIFVIKNTVTYLFIYKSNIIYADQKSYIVNKIDIFINLIRVIAQIVVIVLLNSYLVFLIVDLLAAIIHNLVVSYMADKLYPFIQNEGYLDDNEKKEIFKDVYSAFLYKIAESILGGTDSVLISILVSTLAVGMYSNYLTITVTIETFIILLFDSLTASIGNLIATETQTKRYETFCSMQMISNWIGGYVSICLFFLIQDFIYIWLQDYSLIMDQNVLIAIVVNMYYTICMSPVWTFRDGTGMYKKIKYVLFFTSIINIGLSIILCEIIGVGGILIATTISKVFTCFWYEPKILYKDFFGVNVMGFFKNITLNLIFTLFIGGICYFSISHLYSNGIIAWLFKAIICTVIINVAFFIRYRNTHEFKNVKTKLFGMVKK